MQLLKTKVPIHIRVILQQIANVIAIRSQVRLCTTHHQSFLYKDDVQAVPAQWLPIVLPWEDLGRILN